MQKICRGMLILCLTLLVGCHSWRRAEFLPLPETALAIAQDEANAHPLFTGADWVPSDWWMIFEDAQLAQLMESMLVHNPTLQAAYTTVLLATSVAERVRASLLPNINLGGDVGRQKLSETGVIPFDLINVPVSPGVFIPEYFTQYETQLTLSYNFDIWKKNRNTLRAALSEVQADLADAAFTRLELTCAMAQIYYQIQTLYRLQEIRQTAVDNRIKWLEIVGEKAKFIETETAVNRAEMYLAEARGALLQVQEEIEVKEHQLKAYLAGSFEEQICDVEIASQPLPLVPLPCELPLHLIAHRPDIISQLWMIESAGKLIDVAKAGFYPDFNLAALFGFQTIHFHELFRWPSTYFNVDPAVTLPIFDGGRLLANLHRSEVSYDLAILEYNQRVLNAVKEVLDGLSVLQNEQAQFEESRKIFISQEKNLKLVALRLQNSIDSTMDYLSSELATLIVEDQMVRAQGRAIQAVVGLMRALGGGYSSSSPTV